MRFAVKKRYIDSNPVREVDEPKGRSRYNESDEMDILRPDEIRHFLDNIDNLRYQTLYMLAIMSGARQDELHALTWSDIDWYNSQLIIKRTFQHGRFYDPKSETLKRKIDLGPTVIAKQKEWKLACPPNNLDLIFPSEIGNTHKENKKDLPPLDKKILFKDVLNQH
jgi:integrase